MDFVDYEVSTLGRVKSLKHGKEKILKLNKDKNGYIVCVLSYNGKLFTKKVHQLVAESFLNHFPCGHYKVVHHKDFNKTNNIVENLEIISQKENINKNKYK